MAGSNDRTVGKPLHPLHGVLLAGTVPLYLGGLWADLGYANSYQIQWTNFASWLVAGGNLFAGCALLWAVVSLADKNRHNAPSYLYTVLLAVTWVLGFINSLIHSKDAWASMPTGLILSVIVALLACVSTGIGFGKFGVGGGK